MVDPEVDHEVGRLTHGCGEIVPWRSTLAPGAQHVLRGKKRLVVSSAPIVTEYLDFFLDSFDPTKVPELGICQLASFSECQEEAIRLNPYS